MPQFIVSYGPPASGKSKVFEFAQKMLGVSSLVNINVDDIIAENKDYQVEIRSCAKQFAETDINDVSLDLLSSCNSIYYKYRSKADEESTARLLRALDENRDIVYETTGRDMTWFVTHDLPKIPKNYKICIVYFVVRPSNLLGRAWSRAQTSGRMPEVKTILDIATSAETNFIDLANKHDFTLYVVENETEPKVLFSKTGETVSCQLKYVDLEYLPKLRTFVRGACKLGGGDTNFVLIVIVVLFFLYFWMNSTYKPAYRQTNINLDNNL